MRCWRASRIYRYPLPFEADRRPRVCRRVRLVLRRHRPAQLWVARCSAAGSTCCTLATRPTRSGCSAGSGRCSAGASSSTTTTCRPRCSPPSSAARAGWLHRGLLWLERQSMRAADVVITTNESHKRVAIQRGGKRPADVLRRPLRPRPRALPRARAGPGLPLRQAASAGVSRRDLQAGRRRSHGARGAGCWRPSAGDFHVMFVGGGPHQPAISAYAAEQGIAASRTLHRPRQRRGRCAASCRRPRSASTPTRRRRGPTRAR